MSLEDGRSKSKIVKGKKSAVSVWVFGIPLGHRFVVGENN